MPEIIDVLSPQLLNCPSFVADHTEQYVAAMYAGGENYFVENARARGLFTRGDSFMLLSAGIVLPESFTLYKDFMVPGNAPLPGIEWGPVGVSADYYEFSSYTFGGQYLPFENFETVFNIFFKCSDAINQVNPTPHTLDGEDFFLSLKIKQPLLISMQGVPASFDSKSFRVIPFLKILHNVLLKEAD